MDRGSACCRYGGKCLDRGYRPGNGIFSCAESGIHYNQRTREPFFSSSKTKIKTGNLSGFPISYLHLIVPRGFYSFFCNKNMKRILLFACSLFFCLSVYTAQAQVNDPGQVAKDAASNHANSDMDNAADQGMNKAEQGIGNLFKKKKKDKKSASESAEKSTAPAADNNSRNPSGTQVPPIKTYQNYDFVAGDKIIFDDDFTADQDGEFPAHWGLNKGQAVVNKQQGFSAFTLTDGNYVEVYPKMTEK